MQILGQHLVLPLVRDPESFSEDCQLALKQIALAWKPTIEPIAPTSPIHSAPPIPDPSLTPSIHRTPDTIYIAP